MRSFLKLSVAGSLLLLAALLHRCGVQSASMRQHRTRGGETDARQPGPYFLPSADMVKALEYIERLRQQSDGATEETAPDYDGDVDVFRSQLRTGPAQTQEALDRDPPSGGRMSSRPEARNAAEDPAAGQPGAQSRHRRCATELACRFRQQAATRGRQPGLRGISLS
ncbi:hypothetical protein AAFF_G00131120 [Aldrovandia affinis]|uniref:Uncharacterized protein n=1 Tax=Aldrovandia affinis TaxID=143900 RepID=A0AAD7RQS8_9TELE|nr:hypothetical protein AAFF_G00131120 [Aldrovandia affinis]